MNFNRKKGKGRPSLFRKDPDNCGLNCQRKHRHRFGKNTADWNNLARPDVVLTDCPAGSLCMIMHNPHKMTKEIGVNPGKTIAVFKNEPADSNMIICLDNTRYIIAKSIARGILVKTHSEDEPVDCEQVSVVKE